MTLRSVVAAATAVALLGVSASSDLRSSLRDTAAKYYAQIAAASSITGRDTAIDYLQRLNDDGDLVDTTDIPAGWPQDEWASYVRAIATLDISLVDQLLVQSYRPMGSIRGLGETFVRSSKDGTMQPVAVYVPASYNPAHAAPLVVFLHGHPQSETQLISADFITRLADKTGSIIVAPYGHGAYDFRGVVSDVYDTLGEATKAFNIDPRKKFLVGYSMGGFSVFEVAPAHPDEWAGIMCISGALLGHDARDVTTFLSNKPFYVLTGIKDDSIPTQYPTSTAIFLRNSGLAVSFYSLADGTHRLITLMPILSQAWDDMHQGIVRTPPPSLGGGALPSSPVGGMTKP